MIIFFWFFSDAIFSPYLNKERGIEYTTTLMSVHLFVYTVAGLFQGIIRWTTQSQILFFVILFDVLQLVYMIYYQSQYIYFSTPLFFIQIILYKRYIIINAQDKVIENYLIENEKKISLGLSSGYLLSIFINQLSFYEYFGYAMIGVSVIYTLTFFYKSLVPSKYYSDTQVP